MSSKKAEERNEKIIRGLMKLPPNRRCINCNSLGPQYVCTNFWTFICMTCSGIHREFTHRVKSVSMAKFTSQEVEALQNGGNQRAREIFLKDWDSQRQRLPDNSNVDKVRAFIRNVYVDRKYAGGNTSEKPPRDTQNLRNHEDETRRASSYHSYSQSPPYDYQYEDRRYGKHAPALTRKPGSDRGLYEAKVSGFLSPSRLSDQMYEDRFANEGLNSRFSDYSASSAGDPFRSGAQSPTLQRDIGYSSPSSQNSRDILNDDVRYQTMNTFLEANTKRDTNGLPCPQRTASSSSFGSFDGNSMSLKSVNSVNSMDVASGPQQSAGIQQDKLSTFPTLPQSAVFGNFGGLDLFDAPSAPQTVSSSAPATDLFQLSETSSTPPIDLFQPSPIPSVSTLNAHQPSKSSTPSSLDLFSEIPQQQSAATLDKKSPDLVMPKNEGWATFDVPQHMASNVGIENSTPAVIPSSDGGPPGKFDPLLSQNTSLQWPSFQDFNARRPSVSMSNPWNEGVHNVKASLGAMGTQSWNAFEDSIGQPPLGGIQQSREQVAMHKSSTADQYLGLGISEDLNKNGIQRAVLDNGPPFPSVPSHVSGSTYSSSALPLMEGAHSQSHATDHISTNPFDLPYDSGLESNNAFLDMTSLQAALPNAQTPPAFLDGLTQPWFPQNPATPYIPNAPQGALGLMAGQSPGTQLVNGPTQGPVASVGGNPFA
ncbi:probable ADP-ribosylation factor GTPase-activating protein AGD14 [Cornus florida]|uniref:probable ADP-ribosylation factor GTPase-activating protein AGD14 n=1 Tax=Cornus florida TaxID=4283 RepID=UPI00289D70C2|nr:probable ADP-ribosylation factor GTPase-activating protein AGD14 [Cornus florida]